MRQANKYIRFEKDENIHSRLTLTIVALKPPEANVGRQERRPDKRELEHYMRDDRELAIMRRDDQERPPFRKDDRPYLTKRRIIEDMFVQLNTLPARIFAENKSTGCF